MNIRHVTMLLPTCRTHPLLAYLNADVDQSYISKAVLSRMELERHIKKTQPPTILNFQGKELFTDEMIQIIWCNEGCRTTTRTGSYVAPPGLFDVMLGRDVLDAENCERPPSQPTCQNDNLRSEMKGRTH